MGSQRYSYNTEQRNGDIIFNVYANLKGSAPKWSWTLLTVLREEAWFLANIEIFPHRVGNKRT